MILNLRGHPVGAWTAEPFLGRGANPGISHLLKKLLEYVTYSRSFLRAKTPIFSGAGEHSRSVLPVAKRVDLRNLVSCYLR